MADEPTIPVSVLTLLNESRAETRDLIGQVRNEQTAGFSSIGAKLDGKADKADVESLRSDMRHLGERTEQLETWRRDKDTAAATVATTQTAHVAKVDRNRGYWLQSLGLLVVIVAAVLTDVLAKVL